MEPLWEDFLCSGLKLARKALEELAMVLVCAASCVHFAASSSSSFSSSLSDWKI